MGRPEVTPMHGIALKYLATECAGSFIVNGLLNLGFGYLLFHGRSQIPVGGPTGLLRDSIGEIFLVTGLSYLVAALISRRRGRAGTLPRIEPGRAPSPGNLYLRSLIVGLVFTLIFCPLNAWLLPRTFPNGLSLQQLAWFKAITGAILGAMASYFAISRAFREVHLHSNALQA